MLSSSIYTFKILRTRYHLSLFCLCNLCRKCVFTTLHRKGVNLNINKEKMTPERRIEDIECSENCTCS